MNTKLLIYAFIGFISIKAGFSQCEKEISTNYYDPYNNEFLPLINSWQSSSGPHTVNSFINTSIRWYNLTGQDVGFSDIYLTPSNQWSSPWSGSGNNQPPSWGIMNPFSTSGSGAEYIRRTDPPEYRDFWWENGWELLWSNLGRYPNGDPINSPSTGTYYGNKNLSFNPFPSAIPYFALYNRYTGLIRLFSNTFYDDLNSSWQHVATTLEYNQDDQYYNRISGLLRHSQGSYDQALDMPTSIARQRTPRRRNTTNSEFQLSEFQAGYDPCICLRRDSIGNPGFLDFMFNKVQTMNIDMYSRGIDVEDEITENNFNAVDYLNFSDMDPQNPNPGLRMNRTVGRLFEDYEKRLEEYETKLNDYNSPRNQMAKNLTKYGRELVTGAISTVLPPAAFLSQVSIENNQNPQSSNYISNSLKGLVGLGYDYGVYSIFGKPMDKPEKPVPPVVSYNETTYQGTITINDTTVISNLRVPGGITQDVSGKSYGYGKTDINPHNFPAYNKVLGQVALLESPSVEFSFNSSNNVISSIIGPAYNEYGEECFQTTEFEHNTNLQVKLNDELKIALNQTLDFDHEKTKTFVNIEVTLSGEKHSHEIKNEIENHAFDIEAINIGETNNNMHLSHAFPIEDDVKYIINSKWIPFEEVGQYVFTLNEHYNFSYERTGTFWTDHTTCNFSSPDLFSGDQYGKYKLISIKLKLLHDMYFDQIDSYDEQVNSTQVYTYLLYNDENGDGDGTLAKNVTQLSSPNSLNKYTVGTIHIENEHITPSHNLVFETSGNTIYINAEDIEISGEVTVENGYDLIIQSLYSIDLLDGADIGKNITLRIKKDWFDLEPFAYMDNSEVYNFCNNSDKYKANELDPLPRKRLEKEIAKRELEEMLKKEMPIDIAIHPNPADQQITVSKLQREAHVLVIYDLKGVVVFSQDVSGKDHTVIDVSNFTGGVYIVAVDRENGTVSRKRFVKL